MYGEETFHPDTRLLLALGRKLARGGSPPRPRGAERLAERLFVFDCLPTSLPIRTFGAELTALFGQSLIGSDFATLFAPAERPLVLATATAVGLASAPSLMRVRGETADGAHIDAEILITPFSGPRNGNRRLVLLQPLGGEALLAGRAVERLTLFCLWAPESRRPPTLRLVVSDRERRA
jgi:hypothetical protein